MKTYRDLIVSLDEVRENARGILTEEVNNEATIETLRNIIDFVDKVEDLWAALFWYAEVKESVKSLCAEFFSKLDTDPSDEDLLKHLESITEELTADVCKVASE